MLQEDSFFNGFSYGQDDIDCSILFGDFKDNMIMGMRREDDDQDEELLDFLKNLV